MKASRCTKQKHRHHPLHWMGRCFKIDFRCLLIFTYAKSRESKPYEIRSSFLNDA
ncbi:hypothetical protein Rcae01_04746 [Novipirellula caenicola]|uniref:Uncharacterized protein n=1 Tax=Novipirellula caenicola TaxID=1536901 RepID=A0ABP9VVT4_9BACT